MAINYQEFRDNLKKGGIRLFAFRFHDHVSVNRSNGRVMGGMLPDVPAAHAAWYYVMCAHQMLHEVDSGAQYEGEDDQLNSLNNLVRSISAQYDLDSPSLLIQQIPAVKLEAARCNLGWDERVERPDLADYITKGGGSANTKSGS